MGEVIESELMVSVRLKRRVLNVLEGFDKCGVAGNWRELYRKKYPDANMDNRKVYDKISNVILCKQKDEEITVRLEMLLKEVEQLKS